MGDGQVLIRLGEAARRVVAVKGNNDVPAKLAAASRAAIDELPESARVDLPGGELVVVHGDRVLPARDRHRTAAHDRTGRRSS